MRCKRRETRQNRPNKDADNRICWSTSFNHPVSTNLPSAPRVAAQVAEREECRFGIHDISRIEHDTVNHLPRFNMPFELGLFLGARHFGGRPQRGKHCLVLEAERYRYQNTFPTSPARTSGSLTTSLPRRSARSATGWQPRDHGRRSRCRVRLRLYATTASSRPTSLPRRAPLISNRRNWVSSTEPTSWRSFWKGGPPSPADAIAYLGWRGKVSTIRRHAGWPVVDAERPCDRVRRIAGVLRAAGRTVSTVTLGVVLFIGASAACAAANSLETLVAFRVFQAAGAAPMTPTSLGFLLASVPPDRRGGAVRPGTSRGRCLMCRNQGR
jgi:hypothetical protein